MFLLNTAVAKLFSKCISLIFLLSLAKLSTSQPAINTFAPANGNIGSIVQIYGTNFSAVPENNIVYFGAVRAAVSSASASSLSVTVPAGATEDPISVTVNNLTAYSRLPFIVTYGGGYTFSKSSFGQPIGFPGSNGPGIRSADIDNDGKPDIVMSDSQLPTYKVAVYRNISTLQNIEFEPSVDLPQAGQPMGLDIADMNGDGKLDVIFADGFNRGITILLNNSTPGVISFQAPQSILIGRYTNSVVIGEIDGDGKPDMVIRYDDNNNVSILRNTTSAGNISFAPRIDLLHSNPRNFDLTDYDGDGKKDIIIEHQSSINIFRNTSVAGNIMLDPPMTYSSGSVASTDLDVDGKPDMALVSSSGELKIYRNTGSPGAIGLEISYESSLNLSLDIQHIEASDLNGDGKPDLLLRNWDSVAVLINNSLNGNISFADKINFYQGTTGISRLQACDFNGDGRKDIYCSYTGSSPAYILKNTIDAPDIDTFSPNKGAPGTQVIISGTDFNDITEVSFGGQPAASFSVQSSTSIIAFAGNGNSGKISVAATSGSDSVGKFTFLIPPVINSFTPASTAQGGMITIKGLALEEATAVTFGGIAASSFTVLSDSLITAVVASGASGNVEVTTPYGIATASSFTFSIPTHPSITSFFPETGAPQHELSISGYNFSATSADNIVYLGATRATVLAATENSLAVRIPYGATYGPITVSVNGQTAFSSRFFLPTFTGLGIFNTSSFESPKSFPSNSNTQNLVTGDLDGDGKADIASVSSGFVSVFLNTSTTGSVTFNPKQDFPAGTGTRGVTLADISGDGMPDIITGNYSGSSVSVLRNTSSPGTVSFAAKIDMAAGTFVKSVAATDFDYDGRVDIVAVNEESYTISVFRNTTTGGVISFDPKIDYATGNLPSHVSVGDIDGDGKTDIAVANSDNHRVSAFRNTSSPGVLSFDAAVNIFTGFVPGHVTLADLDQDGKPDMITSQERLSSYVDVHHNTSVPGTISFEPIQTFTTNGTGLAVIGDFNGDSKPDVVVGNSLGNWVSVLRNTSISGAISFGGFLQFSTNIGYSVGAAVSDFDGDGKPDIAATNNTGTSISVLRNAAAEPLVVASGASPVTGLVNKNVTLDATVQTRNGSPYVQRHFDITPVNNPATATGTITLHFTQQEFDQFNAHPAHGGDLPTNATDNIGKANLRVFQFHGTSGSGLPGTYSGSGVEIDPADASIVWDATNLNWTVTFNVVGFSGFFVSSAGNNILPLTLVNFSGKLEGDEALLKWTTTDEVGVDYFEVLRSNDGTTFKTIAKIHAKGNTNSNSVYDYTDLPEKYLSNYYRLKIVDVDGSSEYSKVINLKPETTAAKLILYPNPANGFVQVIHPAIRFKGNIQVFDVAGRVVRSVQVARNAQFTRVDLGGVTKGIYTVVVRDSDWTSSETIVVK